MSSIPAYGMANSIRILALSLLIVAISGCQKVAVQSENITDISPNAPFVAEESYWVCGQQTIRVTETPDPSSREVAKLNENYPVKIPNLMQFTNPSNKFVEIQIEAGHSKQQHIFTGYVSKDLVCSSQTL